MGNQCCHRISNIPEYSLVPDPRYPVDSVQEGSDPPYNKCHTVKGPSPDLIEVYNKSDLLRGWSFSVGKNRPHDLIYYGWIYYKGENTV